MRLLQWLRGDFGCDRDRMRRPRRNPPEVERPEGDFRGSYGFGRRAHRPDPQAHYVFGNDPNRRRRDSETP